jgi:hypothetical protein
MFVKFKTGASAYGLGYLEGEVAEIKTVKTRVLTTLTDANGNVRGQDWRDQDITADLLVEKGVCIQATENEVTEYKQKLKAEAEAAAKK